MITRLALGLVLLAPQPLHAEGAMADVVCAPKAEMERRLIVRFGSSLSATGLRDPETLMQVWTSPQGRWTLVQSYANGQSCIMAMGENWEMPQTGEKG